MAGEYGASRSTIQLALQVLANQALVPPASSCAT